MGGFVTLASGDFHGDRGSAGSLDPENSFPDAEPDFVIAGVNHPRSVPELDFRSLVINAITGAVAAL